MKALILALVWIILVSCRLLPVDRPFRILGNHYLSNEMAMEQAVYLVKREPVQMDSSYFRYSNAQVKRIRYETYRKMDDTVKSISTNGFIKLVAPPKSVLYFGTSSFLTRTFSKIIIGGDTLPISEVRDRDEISVSSGCMIQAAFKTEFVE